MPAPLREALTGCNWSIGRGRRHYRILIDGRQVAIWPHGGGSDDRRALANTISHIRRYRKMAHITKKLNAQK